MTILSVPQKGRKLRHLPWKIRRGQTPKTVAENGRFRQMTLELSENCPKIVRNRPKIVRQIGGLIVGVSLGGQGGPPGPEN